MADSEKLVDITKPGVFKDTPGASEGIIIRRDVPVKVARGEGGKFVKQAKSMPKTQDVTRLLRNLLNQAEAGPDGVLRRGGKTRLRAMFDNIVTIASKDPNIPLFDKEGNPVLNADGTQRTYFSDKIAGVAVQAFDKLALRVYGAYNKSDEELDAMKSQGVKFVVITPPAEMMNKEIVPDEPKVALKPAFLEGEFTEDPKY